MKLTDIVNQLKTVFTRYTTDFCTSLSVISLTRSSSTVTATTSADHGLIAGDKVLIVGAKTPISISSLTQVGGFASAICATKHNLTLANETVEISGAIETEYNGSHNLIWKENIPTYDIASIEIDTGTNVATIATIEDNGFVSDTNFEIQISGTEQTAYNVKTSIASIIDSKTFTVENIFGTTENGNAAFGKLWQVRQVLNAYTFIFEVDSGTTSPATGTITQIYEYQTGYNGYKTVLTAPTTTTFTYAITSAVNSPAQGTITARINPTITGAISYERAKNFYETEYAANDSKKWLVAVMSGSRGNKNDKNKTDALTYGNNGYQIREQSIQDLTFYIFLPAGSVSDELLYTATRDLAETYKPYIYHGILGFKPPSNLYEREYSQLMFTEDDFYEYTGAYYVHYFKFQATNFINQEDAVAPEDLSAFRTFEMDVLDEADGTPVMEISAKMDEEV